MDENRTIDNTNEAAAANTEREAPTAAATPEGTVTPEGATQPSPNAQTTQGNETAKQAPSQGTPFPPPPPPFGHSTGAGAQTPPPNYQNRGAGTPPPPPNHQNRGAGTPPPPPNYQFRGNYPPQGAFPPPPYTRAPFPGYMPQEPQKKKKPVWLFVLLGVLGFFFLIGIIASAISSDDDASGANGVPNLSSQYVAVLYIDDEIAGDYKYTQTYGTVSTYNQVYLIDTIYGLMDDPNNAGIMLYIDSPGGEVTATEELGRAIEYYKTETKRPVYAYFMDVAASGAYWIGSYADKIIAHKYCITGSIGVTYGSHIDISGLLEKLGIKVTSLIAGDNKAMGSMYEPLTEEQKKMYEEQLSEMHNEFVTVVSENRGLKKSDVQNLADGSTMLASKALKLGLIDYIGYYEDAQATMIAECGLEESVIFYDCINTSQMQSLSLYSFIKTNENTPVSEEEAIGALIKELSENRKFMVLYE